MVDAKKLQRLSTGVPGLDTILDGGLFETGVYVFEGAAGAGKTILANQICFHQATLQRRAVYYTLLTEAHDRMIGFLRGHAFFKPEIVPEWISYVSGFKVLEAEGLTGVVRNIRDTVSGRKASLLVIDGLVSAEETAPNETAFKKFIHEIQTLSTMYGVTVILLTNVETAKHLEAEHTMVDGILRLEAPVVKLKPSRTIEVVKFRGAGQVRGTHTLGISDDGITVFPRVETILTPAAKPEVGDLPRRRFAIPSLDEMLRGGIVSGSITMLLGPSGVGKTLLGLHFACGGMPAGEKTMFFTFYEQPRELVSKAKRFGIDAEGAIDRGELRIVWQSSVEATLDKIGARLIAAFLKDRPTRVVIDGIQGFQVTSDPIERIQDFFSALADYFTSHGATMMFTCETEELLGTAGIRTPFPNASRMCQNILLLRFAERHGRLTKACSVVKMRDGDFDPHVRELVIGERGATLGMYIREAEGRSSPMPHHGDPET